VNSRKVVTIHDVAGKANVSVATVSRVLNGLSTVDPELARRVRKAAQEINYVPNTTGRALRRQVSDTLAVVVPDIENPFFTAMVRSLESVAMAAGFAVMLFNTNEDVVRERRYFEAAVANRVAGIVVAVASEVESNLTPLVNARIPIVAVDRRLRKYEGASVIVDNRDVGRLAANHLVEQGYRRLGCIAGPSDVSTTEDRYQGFVSALQELDVEMDQDLLRRADLKAEGGQDAARSLLGMAERPDAIFATNGPLTADAYQEIQLHRLRMPDDIAMIGVDDNQWTRMVSPAVSVIRQPVAEIGAIAGQILVDKTKTPELDPEHILLTPELLARQSTVRV